MPDSNLTHIHYDEVLSSTYVWMAGGFEENLRNNRIFFCRHAIQPAGTGIAVDLGAGCGFQSLALASAGFSVYAVDSSQQMLDILSATRRDLPITIIPADLMVFESWAAHSPELIVCMGDTLTHLPSHSAVHDLIHYCGCELQPGGKIILSFRNYYREPYETVTVIPVRRDTRRQFLCRLEYSKETVRVTDIIYSCVEGRWTRIAGSYTKIRLAPQVVADYLIAEGLVVQQSPDECGMVTMIAEKPFSAKGGAHS